MIRTAIAEEGFCRYNFGSGTDADTFTVEVGTPVPEPSTWAMMLAGFAGLGFLGWRGSGKDRGPRCIVEQKGRSAAPKSAKKAPHEQGSEAGQGCVRRV
jgi:PEP-CTERM motif